MWFFLKRSHRKQEQGRQASPRLLNYSELVAGMGDFRDLAENGIAFKFWLPEPVERALEDLAKYHHESLSMMVRILLTEYVYGSYATAFMRENHLGIFWREPSTEKYSVPSHVLESRSLQSLEIRYVYKVPELGKNVAPIKVWIPKRMKDDLQYLSNHAGMLLSKFVREVIVGGVLGRGSLPERPELGIQISEHAAAWEQGFDVPMREVDRSEIRELFDHRIETIHAK